MKAYFVIVPGGLALSNEITMLKNYRMQKSPLLASLSSVLLLMIPASTIAQNAIKVEAVEIGQRALVEDVPLSGSVTTDRVSRLSTQVSGLVKRLHVDLGDRVDGGDILLELDSELTAIDKARAEAQVEQAREQWSESKRRLREAETLAEGSIAASEVRTLQARERVRRTELDAAQADLDRLAAELERHQLRAPYSGSVSAKQTEEGEWVTPGDALLELVGTELLRADFRVPQRYYPLVQEDAEVRMSFDALPGESFIGQIQRKVPVSQEGSRTFLLRLSLPEEATRSLIPGMSASGYLRIDTDNTGIAVPRDALIRYPDGRVTVWVVDEPEWGAQSQVREQRVETGMSFSGLVEIRSGLAPGSVVVTRGNEALQEGQAVVPEQAAEPRDAGATETLGN
ncbi:efflux RND transporter periplasmic adaptor subunit [Kineobactrum sediminis]|uniref:Efflux RND transporter periplasmic adaptor subunit n=2 Tax=Kineobactrum sediminis TaxID=1905677 RepID=A0A2N5XYR4_9GAMM|nr:efflux RND transporter periplasmic adaptor subunit [Kineobactrum sediminis]